MVLYTIGHGNRSLPELVAPLAEVQAQCLVDVRRHPGSRRNPHLSRERLGEELPRAGVAYQWRGEELGGRRRGRDDSESRHPAWCNASFRAYASHMDGPDFQGALDELIAQAAAQTVAIMCAETLWWRCHRRLIADAATLRGVEVVHLLGEGRSQSHVLHPNLRADEDNRPVYDVGSDRPLLTVDDAGASSPG